MIAELSWTFHQNPLIICWVLAIFPIGQSTWWSGSPSKLNHLFLLSPWTPVCKMSTKSGHNFLSYVANRQKDRQTKQTSATENVTSFAKEVIRLLVVLFKWVIQTRLSSNINLNIFCPCWPEHNHHLKVSYNVTIETKNTNLQTVSVGVSEPRRVMLIQIYTNFSYTVKLWM